MSRFFEESPSWKKLTGIVFAGLIIGIAMGNMPVMDIENVSFGIGDNQGEKVLYDIDSRGEWINQGGILWVREASKFDNNRFEIGSYGLWQIPGYSSSVNYRPKVINATKEAGKSQDSLVLDELNARGYIGGRNESGLSIRIYDCIRPPKPGSAASLEKYCENYTVYKTGLNLSVPTVRAREPGNVEVKEDLSDITIDGYLHANLIVAVNSTKPVPDKEASYWDHFKLTAEEN